MELLAEELGIGLTGIADAFGSEDWTAGFEAMEGIKANVFGGVPELGIPMRAWLLETCPDLLAEFEAESNALLG